MRVKMHPLVAIAAIIGTGSSILAWEIPSPQSAPPGGEKPKVASPSSYPDPEGFNTRRDLILKGLAEEDLGKWRKGFFKGGDPGKYLPGAAMAKLLLDPDAADVPKLMNDNRSYKEHYHFAAVNWARFYPIFESILSEETKKKFWEKAANAGSYRSPSGTENHRTMSQTSAIVLGERSPLGRFGGIKREDTVAKNKKWLRHLVKEMYRAGLGEWDSSTYSMFTLNGLLNIYDFSEDPESRLLARAGLDWMATIYAQKYSDGIFLAPNQRGHAPSAARSITDQTGWLWWGSDADIPVDRAKNFRYTLAAITSGWRPNKVITNLARKELTQLPFAANNTKPNYWAPKGTAKPHHFHESVHVDEDFSLGMLWDGRGGQMTRWQLVVRTPDGPASYTGGQPTGRADSPEHPIQRPKYFDGNGLYCQSALAGSLLANISVIPEDDPHPYAFINLRDEDSPKQLGDWWVWKTGDVWVAAYPLGGKATIAQSEPTKRDLKRAQRSGNAFQGHPILKIEGRKVGFLLQPIPAREVADEAALKAILEKMNVQDSKFLSDLSVTATSREGTKLEMSYDPQGGSVAKVAIDGKSHQLSSSKVMDSPYVQLENSILQVSDGKEGFQIDMSGELPVYTALEQ